MRWSRVRPASEDRWREAQAWEAEFWRSASTDDDALQAHKAGLLESAAWVRDHLAGGLPPGDWLEVGIGPLGLGCIHLLEPSGERELVGVEPLPLIAIDALRCSEELRASLEAARGPRYTHTLSKGESTGLETGRFSLAVLHNMLDHVRDPTAVLAEARRVVAVGGFIVVVCDAFSSVGRVRQRLWGRHRPDMALEAKAHPFRFSRRDLSALAESAGLSVVTLDPPEHRVRSAFGRHEQVRLLLAPR